MSSDQTPEELEREIAEDKRYGAASALLKDLLSRRSKPRRVSKKKSWREGSNFTPPTKKRKNKKK